MKQIIPILISVHLSFVACCQEKGLKAGFQQFERESTKSNLTNRWSWFSVQYDRKVSQRYRFSTGLNFNTSHLFAKNLAQLYNPHPRGKSVLENTGLVFTNYLLLKSYDDNVQWFLTNQLNFNATRIYGTKVIFDSAGNFKGYDNRFTAVSPMFRFDLGLALRARISQAFFAEIRPAYQILLYNSPDFGKADSGRFLFEASVTYRLKKKDDGQNP